MKKLLCILLGATTGYLCQAANPTFTIDVGHASGTVSPRLYGLMTEDINHAYDGGLYAELIQNRAFLDGTNAAPHWLVSQGGGATASVALDYHSPYNLALTNSLRVKVSEAAAGEAAGVANDGYWGIPVQPNTKYRATVIVRGDTGFSGPLTLAIMSEDGKTIYASAQLKNIGTDWKKLETTLKTGKVAPTTKTKFAITAEKPGTFWLSYVSLFPPTWNDRPNGLRKDLMQMLVDMHPKFLRCPGGNFLEGDTLEQRFQWKQTLGPVEERPGHWGPWSYRSTDGVGLLEFLEWAEDLKAEPVLAVFAGYTLNKEYIKAGRGLEPYVQDALEEIEYVIGDPKTTTWGARRAMDGHPKPFPLTYVEVGNEDWFDKSMSYDGRFAQFYDAIKQKYPQLKIISTTANDHPEMMVTSRKPDMIDEHYYLPTSEFLSNSPTYATKYDRNGPEIFTGEWGAYEDPAIKPWEPGAKQQPPTPSMKSAIGDAAFLAAMERNSDLIKMQCYAPLLVNVNPGGRQWRPDLIGYDALTSFGSPSYHAIKMFGGNLGNLILPVASANTTVQGCATMDSKTGEVFVKLVNPEMSATELNISLKGTTSLSGSATATTMKAKPEDLNSIDDPNKVLPVTTTINGVKPEFTFTLPPYSVTVLKMKAGTASK